MNDNGITYEMLTEFSGGTPAGMSGVGKLAYGISTDTRTAKPGDAFIALRGEKFDGHRFLANAAACGCVFAVVDHIPEDAPLPLIVVENTTKALGKIACAYKHLFRTISVAVTGSVGKTTTRDLIYSVLDTKYRTHVTKGNFNNEIGLPLTLFGLTSLHKALLVEMGMNHAGEIAELSAITEPDISVITNIGTSHIENLGSRENIRDAKMEIIRGMKPGGILILNGDEPLLHDVKTDGICRIYVGVDTDNVTYKAENIRMMDDHMFFDIRMNDGEIMNDILVPLIGKHHIMNALIACVCGMLLGICEDKIREGLLAFTPCAMRQHFIEKDGYTVIEDCYNASPESMKAALEVLSHTCETKNLRPVAVLGDMLELGILSEDAHFAIGEHVAGIGAARLITYGKKAEAIARGALSCGMEEDAVTVLDSRAPIDEIAALVRAHIQKGDAVLFKASRAMALERIIALL